MNVTFDGSEWRHGEHTKELVVEKYLSTDKGRRQNTEDISSTVGWSRSFKVLLCRCMIHFTFVIYLESKSWSATYWVWQCEKHLVVLKLQMSVSSKVKDGKEGKLLSRLGFSSGQLYLWNTRSEFKRLCTGCCSGGTCQDHILWYSLHTLSEDQPPAFLHYSSKKRA